ncbi:hypothetical protein K438DRAFT_2110087 [Mycena galopus ATCC 62051]|nr:hypothetical protein K438DRAFT_2110087 [Mycena galopus ATCC 62051]
MRTRCTVAPDPGNSYSYLWSRWRCDAMRKGARRRVHIRWDVLVQLHPAPGSSGVYSKGRKQEEGARRPDMHALAAQVSGPRSVPLMRKDVQGRGRGGAKCESCAWERLACSASAPSRHRCLRFREAARSATSAHKHANKRIQERERRTEGSRRERAGPLPARRQCVVDGTARVLASLPEAQEHSGAMRIPGAEDTTHSILRAARAGTGAGHEHGRWLCMGEKHLGLGSTIPSALNLQCARVLLVALPCTITAARRYRLLPQNALTQVGASPSGSKTYRG